MNSLPPYFLKARSLKDAGFYNSDFPPMSMSNAEYHRRATGNKIEICNQTHGVHYDSPPIIERITGYEYVRYEDGSTFFDYLFPDLHNERELSRWVRVGEFMQRDGRTRIVIGYLKDLNETRGTPTLLTVQLPEGYDLVKRVPEMRMVRHKPKTKPLCTRRILI